MSVTIRDVAKKAGVGLGTVSRVLNKSPQVSDGTRQRVLDVIDELDYSPSPIARRLSLGKTHTIAAIIPFFTRPAAVERLRGVANTLAGTEYDLIVFNVETLDSRDVAFNELVRRERVDGVLLISLPLAEADLERFKKSGIPLVIIDVNELSLNGFNQILVDDIAGGRKAVEYLFELGHQRIGYISDPLEDPFHFTASRARFEGYCKAHNDAEIPVMPELHQHGEHGRYEARRLAAEMLSLPERPTAIFAASDTQAIGVMEAARERGFRVPRDLSVIGYDDIELAEHLGLTTIQQLLFESGQKGVELLLAVIADAGRKPTSEILPTELVIRNTSSAPGVD